MLAALLDPAIRRSRSVMTIDPPAPAVEAAVIRDAADRFVDAPTTFGPVVAHAYQDLAEQTDRQFAALTDPNGPYRLRVVYTAEAVPYDDADQLIAAVRSLRTLEATTTDRDRRHPLLGGSVSSAYFRFRAVHDLVGHVATGYGFDPNGEYAAWLTQRSFYRGLARRAAATELHGEISVLWTTNRPAEHKAALLEPISV